MAAGPGASPRHRRPVHRLAMAAVGPPRPYFRRSAGAHRGAQGRRAAARRAPPCRGGARRGNAFVCGRRRSELSGGVPARSGHRRGAHADRGAGAAHCRADAALRRRHAAAGLLPRPVADDRRLPAAVDRPTAGGAEGGRHQERVLCGEQRGPVGDAGARVDAAGDAGPARHRSQGSEVHHRDGAGGLRQVTRRAVARCESHRAEEAADESGRPVSPRRKVEADEQDFFDVIPKPPRRRGLPIIATLATLLLAAAITASTLILIDHEKDRRASIKEAAALGYVREFMTAYTTLDPFHANDYAARILAQGTGDFAKMFKQKENEILVQVARAEPTKGTVVEAGVQRWNDNGSADVLVATKGATKSPDGKSTIESGNRWVATAIKEGQQWKISQLIQVI